MFNTDESHDLNGHAILLKFRSIRSLNNYIKLFYEKSTSVVSETRHDLQLSKSQVMESSKNETLMAPARKRRVLHNKSYIVRQLI